MLSKISRRKFMRASGTTVGLTGLSGLTSAKKTTKASNLDVKVDTVVESGIKYSACIAQNLKTGEIDGAVIPVPTSDGSTNEIAQLDANDLDVHEISEDVLADIRESVFSAEVNSSSTAVNSDSSTAEQSPVWGPLRNAASSKSNQSDGVTIQAKSILEDVLEEISAGTKDSIDRIGAYYIESPKGTDCDAAVNSQPHHQLGFSVEYEKVLGDFTETVLTTVLGAALGLLIGGPYGGAIGTIAGAIVGFAIKYLKDTTNITQVIRDIDKCAFEECAPSTRLLVSGVWMDEDTDLLTINGTPDVPAVHLENGVQVNDGYRETVRVSS
ncbi:glycine zipper family protein [Halorussus pelagicus]|uniref:glycine zipper family protein n=1 Tax=Halorussus pelagicus TaxID=2505977 RepID=UPI001AA03B73|nr:glycine zipper family protein [Halorussus pelagicus]